MDKRWHILILANQPHDAALLEDELRKIPHEAEFEQVSNRESFLREMDAFLPDLIVAEHSLLSFDAIAVLSVVRVHSPEVPVIVVSDQKGEETAIEAMQSGAADYLLKENIHLLASKAGAVLQQIERKQLGRVHSRVMSAVRGYEIHELEHEENQPMSSDWLENRLNELERDFSAAVLNTIGALILVLDREGRIVGFNRSCEKTTGHPFSEVRNRFAWDLLVPPEEKDKARQNFQELVDERLPSTNEHYWITKKGERLLISWTNAVISDRHGDVEYIIGTGIDVTEQRQTEFALRENEERLRAILDTAVDGIITIDDKGIMKSANPAARRIFGYTEEELIGNNIKMLMPDPYHSEHDMYLRNYLDTGIPKIIGIGREVVGKRRNGSVFPMELAVSEVRLQNSVLFTGLIRDISVRRMAEIALRESQERFSLATQAADIGTWLWDLASGEAIFSDKSKELFGLQPDEELSFENFLDKLHPDDRLKVDHAINEALDKGHDYTTEYRVVWPDKSIHWILARGRGVDEALPKPRRMIGVHMDITPRKNAEERLHEVARDLQRSNKDLEQFAYIVSHDLQEPLRMVRGYLQLIEKKYKTHLDSDAQDFIHFAVDGASRMQAMIADLLAFSRVGTKGEQFSETSLEEVLELALANLRMVIEQKGAIIRHDPLPVIPVDKPQLCQLFQNLIGNALKFSKKISLPLYILVRNPRMANGTFLFPIMGLGSIRDTSNAYLSSLSVSMAGIPLIRVQVLDWLSARKSSSAMVGVSGRNPNRKKEPPFISLCQRCRHLSLCISQ